MKRWPFVVAVLMFAVSALYIAPNYHLSAFCHSKPGYNSTQDCQLVQSHMTIGYIALGLGVLAVAVGAFLRRRAR